MSTDKGYGYDYNCSGGVTKLYNSIGSFTSCSYLNGYCNFNGSDGWNGSIANCGVTAKYLSASVCSTWNGNKAMCVGVYPNSSLGINRTQVCR